MKALVTGASGFIGQHLVNTLTTLGISVYPTSRNKRDGYIKFDPLRSSDSFEQIKEISPQVVINLSWCTDSLTYLNSTENDVALAWNRALYEILALSDVRRVISIGSAAEKRLPSVNSLADNATVDRYSRTKGLAYESFLAHFSQTDKYFSWLRVFQVFGPGQAPERLIPTLAACVKANRIFVLRQPNAVRDWIDVRDVCDSIYYLIEGASESEIDIGTGIGLQNLELCKLMQNNFGLEWSYSTSNKISPEDRLVASSQSPLFRYFIPKRDLFEYIASLLK